MKKFPLDGENEGKEASLFIVPINVKGEMLSWICVFLVLDRLQNNVVWNERTYFIQDLQGQCNFLDRKYLWKHVCNVFFGS